MQTDNAFRLVPLAGCVGLCNFPWGWGGLNPLTEVHLFCPTSPGPGALRLGGRYPSTNRQLGLRRSTCWEGGEQSLPSALNLLPFLPPPPQLRAG